MTVATQRFGKHGLKTGRARNKGASPSAGQQLTSTRFRCNGYAGKGKSFAMD